MRRKLAEHLFLLVSGRVYLLIIGSSEGVEPRHQFRVAFPPGWFTGSGRSVHFVQSPAFGFKVSLRIAVSGVEAGMPKPAANHRHINASRYKTGRCRVTKRVRRDSLT